MLKIKEIFKKISNNYFPRHYSMEPASDEKPADPRHIKLIESLVGIHYP
jgi:hypothetical protein